MASVSSLLEMDYADPHPASFGLDPLSPSGRNHNLQDPYRTGHNFASPLFSSFGTPMFPLSKPAPYDSFVPYTSSEQSEPTTEQYDNLSSDWDQLDMKISRLNLASSHDSEDDSSFMNRTVGSTVGEDMGIANIHQPMVGRSQLAHPGLAPWENHSADNAKTFAPDMFSRFAYPRGGMEPNGVPNLAGSSFIPPNSNSGPMLGNHLDMHNHNGPSISAFPPRNYPGVNPNNPYPNPLFVKMPQHPAAFSTAPMNGAYAEVPRPMGQPTRNNPPSPRKTEPETLPAANQSLNNQTIPTCRYFANGYCSRGDRCNYSHIAPDDKEKDKRAGAPSARANSRGARPVRPQVAAPVVEPPAKKLPIDVSRVQTIDQVLGQIYRICKDQHGCRFLQTKLEEKDPHAVDLIFDEVYDHMVELMTDPFGNYLCQKLMEHCNEQQQLLIVQKVAPHLVNISKNMHGTRAVQKMIECLCTASQVALVVNSLKSSVVELIQDLNGNHVIQRCLVKLSIKDNQFVYDAVAANCVAVATHRHGCCVMQRCIDHASQEQQLQLIREIANNVLVLVKDPFGNYVVQYVLDLPFAMVKVRLIQKFLGHLAVLSTQKFSSNVIEKCLGVADEKVKVQLIEELTQPATLQCLLQDPYGNYVIQTALSLARPQQRARLVEEIKPLLPALRNTPYGKRIQNLIV